MGILTRAFNQMVDELIVSKAYIENIINSMVMGLVVVDPEGTITMINQAALDLLGYEENELIGKPLETIFAVEAGLFQGMGFKDLAKKDFIRDLEETCLAKDGSSIPVSYSSSVMHDRDGQIQAIICGIQDITGRKQAEVALKTYAARLEQSNLELEQFAYVASHDLQEPLRKVQAFGDRLQAKYGEVLNDQGRDYLARMQDAARRMQTLINDLLAYSRVTTTTQAFRAVDLNQIVNEVVSDLEIQLEQVGGRVEIGELPTIEADTTQMRQLFQNLIGNALKFHRQEVAPIVKVQASPLSRPAKNASGVEWCQITVEDNGIGFDEKYLDRIFKVFQRLHGREEYEGSGVGLATCRKIVERHGGSITAKSTPGQGTTFTITLPLKQPQGESRS